MQSKTWLFKAKERNAFILVRSPYKNNAKKKVAYVSDGQGLLTWDFGKLSEEEEKTLLEKYETDTLYEAEVAIA